MRASVLGTGIAALLLGAACTAPPALSDPRYGVCRQQIDSYVRDVLQHTPTEIRFQSYAERKPPITDFDTGNALVFVEECDGFHSFEVRGTLDLCEYIPHYGRSSGSYVRYEGGFEGCRTG